MEPYPSPVPWSRLHSALQNVATRWQTWRLHAGLIFLQPVSAGWRPTGTPETELLWPGQPSSTGRRLQSRPWGPCPQEQGSGSSSHRPAFSWSCRHPREWGRCAQPALALLALVAGACLEAAAVAALLLLSGCLVWGPHLQCSEAAPRGLRGPTCGARGLIPVSQLQDKSPTHCSLSPAPRFPFVWA